MWAFLLPSSHVSAEKLPKGRGEQRRGEPESAPVWGAPCKHPGFSSRPILTAGGPQVQPQPVHSLKDYNNRVFVGQWLMTYRNFIHGSPVFSGYRDDQVKTKHIRGIEFPNLDHRGRGKGKKKQKRVGGGRVTVEVKQTAIAVISLR